MDIPNQTVCLVIMSKHWIGITYLLVTYMQVIIKRRQVIQKKYIRVNVFSFFLNTDAMMIIYFALCSNWFEYNVSKNIHVDMVL